MAKEKAKDKYKPKDKTLYLEYLSDKSIIEKIPSAILYLDFTEIMEDIELYADKSIKQISNTLENNPNIITSLAKKIKVIDANSAAVKLYQTNNKNNLLGRLTNILTTQSLPILEEILLAFYKGSKSYSWSFDMFTLKGSIKSVECSINLEKYTKTEAIVSLIFIDISEKRKYKTLLDQNKETLSKVLNSSLTGMFIINDKGVIIYYNSAFRNIFHYNDKDIIGKKYLDFVAPKSKKDAIARFESRLNDKAPINNYIFTGITKDGNELELEINVSVIYDDESGLRIIGHILDLTLTRSYQNLIESKERKINNLLLHTSDSILIGDTKGNIIECNYSIIRLSGYTKHELLRMNISELFSEKILSRKPLKYNLLNEGMNVITQRMLLRKNGDEVNVEMNSNLLPDNNYISIIRDITDRVKYEKKLIESENQFSSIVENSFQGIGLIDENQKFIYCNSVLSEITGYTKNEIIGSNFEKYLSKESRPTIRKRFYDRINNKKVSSRFTFSIIRKDGQIRMLENSAAYYIAANGKPYTIVQLKDITEQYYEKKLLKISENRFRSIVEHSFNGIGLIDSNYKFVYANDELSNIFDYSINEIIGTNFKTFLTPQSIEMVTDRYKRRQQGEKVTNKYEFTIKRKNGSIRFVEMTSTIIYNFDEEKQTLVQLQDITERKEINEAIKISREQYKAIFDGAYDAIIHLDKDFNILNVNHSFIEMSGLYLEELKNKKLFYIAQKLLPKDEATKTYNLIKSSFINGEIKPIELKIADKTIELAARKHSNNETIAIIRNITSRKEAERALHKSEAKYQQLFNSSPDPIIIHDGKRILDINPATVIATKIKDKSELIGKHLSELAHPKEKTRTEERIEKLKTAKQALNSEEFVLLLPNGEVRNTIATPAPIEIDGKKRFMVTYHDITQLKEKEKQLAEAKDYLQNIFDSTSDAIFVYDAKTYCVINFNHQVETLYGYTKEDLQNNKIPLSSNNEKSFSKPNVISWIKKAKKEGKQTFEWLAKHKNGNSFWVEVSLNYTKIGKQEIIIASVRDIDDRKRASIQLQESQERLNQLSSLSFEGIIIHENGKAIDVNYAFERISGYSREEILNNNIIEMFVIDEYKDITYDFMKNNYTHPYEIVGVNKAGKKVDIEIESRNIVDNNKKFRVTAIRDISERKIEQAKLEKSNQEIISREKSFRAIFNNGITAIYVQDKDGKFIDVNNGAIKMYGYSKEELIGKDPSFVSAESKNDLTQINKLFTKAFNGEPQHFEFWGKRKNGEIFPKEVRISKGIYSGKEVVFAFATDVSENKKKEEVQNILFNISNAGNYYSMEEFISYIKNELNKILDTTNFYIAFYNPDKDLLSFPYYSDEKDTFKTAKAKQTLSKYVITTGKPLLANLKVKKEFTDRGILSRQGTFSKIWMGAPLFNNGKAIGIIAVQNYENENIYNKEDLKLFSFVAEQIGQFINRKKQEDELKQALKKAEESDRLKSAFLANMSHEIRTPMNGILGFTSLLKENILEKNEQKEAFDIIEKSGNRLLNIINDLIDISKIEAGQIKVEITEYKIYDQLVELYNFFKLETRQKKLDFKLNVKKELRDIVIKTDNNKMQAIISNLIKNAIKYTPQGEIEFGYQLMTNHIKFYVKDTGLGIAQDRQKAIFERFVQADIEDRKAMEGAGLGLAITKAYINLLNGDLWLKSKLDKGSTFFFSIPFDYDKSQYPQQTENLEDKQVDVIEEIDNNIINILIAEDDKISFYYLKTLLKFKNVRIFHAINGLEAIALAEEHPDIDLILMDIKMPKMGGLEATRLIRRFNKDVIIIAQTANAMEYDKDKSLDAGCNDYLTKPLFKDTFIKTIEDNLKRKLE